MARCPVCKAECGEKTTCNICGFNDVNRIFINRDEAAQWEQNVLLPYKVQYQSTLNADHILKIKGERLVKYYKSSKKEYVIIPEFVSSMAPSAFKFCDKIKEIYIPDNISELPVQAFIGCDSLEKIRLSENLTYIPEGAFSFCRKLKSIYIPANVKSIHAMAFQYCDNLQEIIVSPKNKHIKNINGFLISNGVLVKIIADPNLLKIVSIPEGVTSIERGSLAGYRNLSMIILPKSLEYIGLHSFYGFDKLESISIPSNVRYIGPNAFANCNSIKNVTVDTNNSVFKCVSNCIIENDEIIQGFSSSEIPKDYSVRRIATYAFTNVKRNSPLFIPNTIEYIDDGAFEGEFDIYCDVESKPAGWSENWCKRYHKGNIFFIRDDGLKIKASREQIEGKR